MRKVTALRLWIRCWGLRPLLFLGITSCAAWFVVPRGPVAVPAGGGVESVLWPLLPTVAILAVPGVVTSAYGDLERTAGRSTLLLRLRALASCIVVVSVVALFAVRFDSQVVWRNTALLLGLALVSSVCLPQAVAWQPLVLLPMTMWLFGTDERRQIRRWDLLLLPGDRGSAAFVSALTLVVGVAGYLTAPGRSRRS